MASLRRFPASVVSYLCSLMHVCHWRRVCCSLLPQFLFVPPVFRLVGAFVPVAFRLFRYVFHGFSYLFGRWCRFVRAGCSLPRSLPSPCRTSRIPIVWPCVCPCRVAASCGCLSGFCVCVRLCWFGVVSAVLRSACLLSVVGHVPPVCRPVRFVPASLGLFCYAFRGFSYFWVWFCSTVHDCHRARSCCLSFPGSRVCFGRSCSPLALVVAACLPGFLFVCCQLLLAIVVGPVPCCNVFSMFFCGAACVLFAVASLRLRRLTWLRPVHLSSARLAPSSGYVPLLYPRGGLGRRFGRRWAAQEFLHLAVGTA